MDKNTKYTIRVLIICSFALGYFGAKYYDKHQNAVKLVSDTPKHAYYEIKIPLQDTAVVIAHTDSTMAKLMTLYKEMVIYTVPNGIFIHSAAAHQIGGTIYLPKHRKSYHYLDNTAYTYCMLKADTITNFSAADKGVRLNILCLQPVVFINSDYLLLPFAHNIHTQSSTVWLFQSEGGGVWKLIFPVLPNQSFYKDFWK